MADIKRIVYRYEDGNWNEVEFSNIKKDDVFMIYEKYNLEEPITTRDGRKIFKAKSDAIKGIIEI